MSSESHPVLVLSPESAPSALDFFTVDLPFDSECLRIKNNITTYAMPSVSRVTQIMSRFDKKFHIVAFGKACRYVVEAMEMREFTGGESLGTVILVEPHLKSTSRISTSGADLVWVIHNPKNISMAIGSQWFSMATRGPTFHGKGMKSKSITSICDHIKGNTYSCLQKRNIAKFKSFIIRTINEHSEMCQTS